MNDALRRALQLHQAKRVAEALPLYAEALEASPDEPAALYYGAVAAWSAGDAALALARLDRLLARVPPAAEAHYHRALARAALGRASEAIADYRAALRLKPAFAAAHNNLGLLLQAQGELDAAEAAFADALRHDPAHAEARYNRALNAMRRGDVAMARDLLRECVRRAPDDAAARAALTDTLLDLAEQSEALALARAGVQRLPDAAVLWAALGHAEQAAGHIDEAIAAFARAVARDSERIEHALNLAHLQNENADGDGARETYARATAAAPQHAGLAFRLATLMPAIPASEAAIDAARADCLEALNALRERGVRLADPLNEYGDTPFYLSYHGRSDDRQLLAALGATLDAAAPSLAWVAPHCDGRARRGGALRVGFCSHFLFDQSVGRAMHAVIRGLPRADCEVHIFRVPPHFDDALARAIDRDATVHRLPFDLAAARGLIAAQELDLLVYPEIGMDALTCYLAHARLAPEQWTTHGHPCTSGLPPIDRYVSFTPLEPEGAEAHYSETLVRLPTAAIYPDYPAIAAEAWRGRGRRALGLPEDVPLLICPQSLFKLMPQFDEAIAGVLDALPEARLLLPAAAFPGQTAALRERLAARLGAAATRIDFVPRRPRAEFVALIDACDVLLDPFPVGGGITTWDALATGTPIVSRPGTLMRSRFAAAALTEAGLASTLATTTDDYVAIVARLLRSDDERAAWRSTMRAASGGIHADRAAVDGWVAAVQALIA